MIIHKDTKSLLLRIRPAPLDAIRKIFPKHSKAIDYQGHNIAVKHELEVVKVLRNMGIKAPSPIRYYYHWPRPPRFKDIFQHQYATADFLTLHHRCFVLNQQGTCKTSSVLWAADYLMEQHVVQKAVIVAPLSTLELVWLNEIFSICMHRNALVLHGSAEKRKELLARNVDFYIINHDGLKIVAKDLAARKDINLMIVDEAAEYRNAQTDRYAVLKKVAAKKRLWLMTGTPCPNAPTDAWALVRLVDETRVPSFFSSFRRMTMNQVTQYKWAPKPEAYEIAYNAMQPAIRFKKSDCLDLPSVTYTSRQCELTPEQKAAYTAMKNYMVAEDQGKVITAVNAADKITKLRQILCGAIKMGDEYSVIPHALRTKVLLGEVEHAAAKVLVIVPFKGIVHALKDEVQDYFDHRGDGEYCEVVNGDVSIRERNLIFQRYRDDPKCMLLLCHPQVMSHGLNLVQADTMIFYAPIYSNNQSEQVMDRINRPGQTLKMTIVRIGATPLEWGIYEMVEGRRVSQENILSLYKRELQM